ncbi:hypothetical protein [[Kitasatospora] papulosa]|uniref:hypothetical protein n=1 Tax=[Kitasatospora] papulosa TaxID=1464011 RepID=UPI002E30B2F8|nr:hypothetical protein [[Kitasatospora] papulosa]
MKVLGIAIAAGALQYGALQYGPTTSLIPGAPERLVKANGLTGTDLVADTYRRIKQDIHGMSPSLVILVATRKHAQWPYRPAADRASLETLVHLACHEEGIRCEEWKTDKIGKLLEVPPKAIDSFELEQLGLTTRPVYWTQGRGDAFAAALAALYESTAQTDR